MDLQLFTASQTWTMFEWIISGLIMIMSAIITWGFWINFTVVRHNEELKQIRIDMSKVATRDDIIRLQNSVDRLLDWVLGTPRHTSPRE